MYILRLLRNNTKYILCFIVPHKINHSNIIFYLSMYSNWMLERNRHLQVGLWNRNREGVAFRLVLESLKITTNPTPIPRLNHIFIFNLTVYMDIESLTKSDSSIPNVYRYESVSLSLYFFKF